MRTKNCVAIGMLAVMSFFVVYLAPTVAHAQMLAGPNRPERVPEEYVITPSGYFHPSCALRLAEGDALLEGGHILRHADGSLENIPACAYPRYTAKGEIVAPNATEVAPPSISHSWIEYASTTTTTSYGAIDANWTVPPDPLNDGQTVYFFPGFVDYSHVVSILQPVLGWNADFDNAWGIASWNCCINGVTQESPPVQVNPGDTITGLVLPTCAAGTLRCATWNITTEDTTTGEYTRLLNSPVGGQTFNWAFAGALEVYNVSQCGDYPPDDFLTFYNVQLSDYNFNLIANPGWSTYVYTGLTPECSYGVQVTQTQATLLWGGLTLQTITFTVSPPSSAPYDSSFTVSATASSGLAVSYSSSGVCTNSGATFTMTSGTGTCTVKFDQAGNSNYSAATEVTESVTAQLASQTINVTTPAPSTAVYNTSFTVAATGGGSGNPATFSSGGVCTNVGATFTMTSGTGTCTVKFDQAGNSNYSAAPEVTESVTAQLAVPVVSLSPSSLTFAAIVGTSSSAQTVTLTNTGNGPLTISNITAGGDFSQTNTCGTTVNAGANCAIYVTFKPLQAGTRTGTLWIFDNATGSPQTVALSGTGLVFTVGPHPPVVSPRPPANPAPLL